MCATQSCCLWLCFMYLDRMAVLDLVHPRKDGAPCASCGGPWGRCKQSTGEVPGDLGAAVAPQHLS